ncbi:MAG TPA: cupin domain-containing protein [Feifaniaceae bacterium]|nr:cupin domain-containing protein [Feifaniaceae bacterium]
MIRYQKDMREETKPNMRGGEGSARLAPLFEEHIPYLRLLSSITLEPGCSIGRHPHEAEAEIFYVLEGEATVLDNGAYAALFPGDAHLCRSGETHELKNNGTATLRVLAIIPTLAE